ncbi:hypothetical protein Tco_1011144 [Tanacetum coccineum]
MSKHRRALKAFSSYKDTMEVMSFFGSIFANGGHKGQICDNKCRVTFSEHDSEITKDGKVIEPKNVNEALEDESWIVAMQEELNQFIANDVWELVPQPKNMKIIGTKWVFRNKLDENGVVSRNKARPRIMLVSASVHASKRIPKPLILKRLSVSGTRILSSRPPFEQQKSVVYKAPQDEHSLIEKRGFKR